MGLQGATAQGKTHAQDQPAPGVALEQAVAITEGTFCQTEVMQFARLAVEGGQAGEHVLDLDPVGAHILHRRGAPTVPGNQAEVFQARRTLRQCPLHERDATASPASASTTICSPSSLQHAGGHWLAMCSTSASISLGQQQVAAAADHQHRQAVAAAAWPSARRTCSIIVRLG